jgi:hypothetical protein
MEACTKPILAVGAPSGLMSGAGITQVKYLLASRSRHRHPPRLPSSSVGDRGGLPGWRRGMMGGFRLSREKRTTRTTTRTTTTTTRRTRECDIALQPLILSDATPIAQRSLSSYSHGDDSCSCCRVASALQTAGPEWRAYLRDLGGMRRSPLTRVGQPKDPS